MADRLGLTEAEALKLDEDVERGLDRILGNLAPVADFYGDVDPALLKRSGHHEAAEAVIREVAATGRAVILGRAGAVVLADDDRALHVRLTGPAPARVEQAMRLEGLDHDDAERRAKKTDRAREAYVKRYYNCDARDPSLYDVVLDSHAAGARRLRRGHRRGVWGVVVGVEWRPVRAWAVGAGRGLEGIEGRDTGLAECGRLGCGSSWRHGRRLGQGLRRAPGRDGGHRSDRDDVCSGRPRSWRNRPWALISGSRGGSGRSVTRWHLTRDMRGSGATHR